MSTTRGGGGLEVRLLGPLQALNKGRPVLLGGVRQRALLAVRLGGVGHHLRLTSRRRRASALRATPRAVRAV
jgi:hypothetical protein